MLRFTRRHQLEGPPQNILIKMEAHFESVSLRGEHPLSDPSSSNSFIPVLVTLKFVLAAHSATPLQPRTTHEHRIVCAEKVAAREQLKLAPAP